MRLDASLQHREERIVNWDQIEGKWEQMKGKVQQKWGELTDDDIDQIKGRRQELEGRLQERYGYQKEQAKKAIDDWSTSL